MEKHFERYIKELAKYLNLHGTISTPYEIDPTNYTELIKQFQSDNKLPVTGLTDADTLWALQYPFAVENAEYSIKKIMVDTDNSFDCLPSFNIRSDCYQPLISAFAEIHQQGGKVFSSGSLRSLNATVTPGRSHTSLHYTGIALDLCINAGFTNPAKDPYVIVREKVDTDTTIWRDTDVYFRIYCRSEKGTVQKLNAIYWENRASKVDLYQEIEDTFICITDIMMKYGFTTIAPRSGFLAETNRNYLSAEWWHFNGGFNIVRGFSQFGIELIKTFGIEAVQNSPVWGSHKATYDYSGFIMSDFIDPTNY